MPDDQKKPVDAPDYPLVKLIEVIAGAHVHFDVPEQPSTPLPIPAIKDDDLRQRATDAWESAWTLKSTWALWRTFVNCACFATFPDKETQETIAARFPALALMGPVLEALSQPKPLRGKRKKERELADERAGVTRGPTRRWGGGERKDFKGPRLATLVVAFQKLVSTETRAVWLLGPCSPEFSRPIEEMVGDALYPLAVMQDHTGDGPVIDFQRESRRLADGGYRRLQAAVGNFLSQLESRPTVALRPESTQGGVSDGDVGSGGTAVDLDDSEGEYEDEDEDEDEVHAEAESGNEHEDRDTESRDPPYLEIQLNDETGQITRDGFDDGTTLSRTLKLLLRILIKKEGQTATFDQLKYAWPETAKIVSSRKIRKQISRLRGAIESFDLLLENDRDVGFKLLDGRSPGEVE